MLEQDKGWSSAANMERMAGFLPTLEEEMGKIKAIIVTRARTAATDGRLTPEFALQLWAEFLAADGLLRRMSQKVALSASAAERALTEAHSGR